MKVLTVVVTHNRSELLERCLDAINLQSDPTQDLLVINNGSTDDTEEMLSKKNVWFITQENVGSAGGWHTGLQIGLEKRYDACWLMDDDGYPHEQALKNLKLNFNQDTACISSVVLKEDKNSEFVFPFPVLSKNTMPKLFGLPRKIYTLQKLQDISKNQIYPFAHLFNGALISMNAVKRIGNVNKDFYLMGDEVDFFYRLKNYGLVASSLNAYHFHPDVSKRQFNNYKIYFYIKNSFIINSRYYNAVFLRNILVIVAIISRVTSRNGPKYLFSILFGSNSKYFYKAIYRGLNKRIGNDINV
jgi:GT2 family glycosyltransferase